MVSMTWWLSNYLCILTSQIYYFQLFHVQYSFIFSLFLTIFIQELNKLFEFIIVCFCMRNYMHTPRRLVCIGPAQHNSHLYQIRPLEIWYHIPYIYFTVSSLQWLYVIKSHKTLHVPIGVIYNASPPILYLFRQNTTTIANWNREKSMLAISYWGQRLAEHEVIGVKFFLLLRNMDRIPITVFPEILGWVQEIESYPWG